MSHVPASAPVIGIVQAICVLLRAVVVVVMFPWPARVRLTVVVPDVQKPVPARSVMLTDEVFIPLAGVMPVTAGGSFTTTTVTGTLSPSAVAVMIAVPAVAGVKTVLF